MYYREKEYQTEQTTNVSFFVPCGSLSGSSKSLRKPACCLDYHECMHTSWTYHVSVAVLQRGTGLSFLPLLFLSPIISAPTPFVRVFVFLLLVVGLTRLPAHTINQSINQSSLSHRFNFMMPGYGTCLKAGRENKQWLCTMFSLSLSFVSPLRLIDPSCMHAGFLRSCAPRILLLSFSP